MRVFVGIIEDDVSGARMVHRERRLSPNMQRRVAEEGQTAHKLIACFPTPAFSFTCIIRNYVKKTLIGGTENVYVDFDMSMDGRGISWIQEYNTLTSPAPDALVYCS